MTSRYSIIQYVPNPIADERINIGVLVFDCKIVKVHFLSNWDRVRCFGRQADIKTLKNFADRMEKSTQKGLLFPGDQPGDKPKHERLLAVSRGGMNSIQFTQPRGSLETVDRLLEEAIQTYLLEPEPKIKLRDRQAAARVAVSHVRKVLKSQFEENLAKELLKKEYQVKGQLNQYHFDVAVANGKPFLAAQGISFEVKAPKNALNSLAWMISDTKKAMPDLPLAIIVLPPKSDTPNVQELKQLCKDNSRTYESLGAEVVTEDRADSWILQQLAVVRGQYPHLGLSDVLPR